jgi:hypothetical protein
MAYDGSNFVLCGGYSYDGNALNDTWVWNGIDTNWTQVSTPTDVSGRLASAMASDGTTILRFGGFDFTNILNDTWKWEGGSWTQQPQQDISGLAGASMAYDGTQFVMFGGVTGNGEDVGEEGYINETRIWDSYNSIWSLVSTTPSPPPRAFAGMAFDGKNVVLVGGITNTDPLSDTWLWNGNTQTWTEVTGTPSPGKASMVLA